ncbi:response regulator transcription factor [Pacificimonas sp. ICDLI1SI03]
MNIRRENNQIVYLVDDDPGVRDSTAFLLDTMSIKNHAFERGEAFIEALDELSDGCLLLDLMMPGAGGFEVMRDLAARKRPMPVILMTAASSAWTIRLAPGIGPFKLLEKPFAEDMLLGAIEDAFEMLGKGTCSSRAAQAKEGIARLSAGQFLLLRGLISGMDTPELCQRLDMSELEVRRMRARVQERIGAPDIYRAMEIGEAAGLLPLTDF